MAKGMACHSIELQKGIPFAEHHSGKPFVEPCRARSKATAGATGTHTQVHCPFLHSLSLFTSSIANLSWATCSQVKLKLSDSQRGARGVALAASPAPSRISSGQVLHRRRASFSMRAPTRPDPMIVLFCLFANCQKRRQAKLTAAGTARCTDELYDNVFNSSATTFAL